MRGPHGSHSATAPTTVEKWPKNPRILLRILAYMAPAKKRPYKPDIAAVLNRPRRAGMVGTEIALTINILRQYGPPPFSSSLPGMER
jgi:hypothetical protein